MLKTKRVGVGDVVYEERTNESAEDEFTRVCFLYMSSLSWVKVVAGFECVWL